MRYGLFGLPPTITAPLRPTRFPSPPAPSRADLLEMPGPATGPRTVSQPAPVISHAEPVHKEASDFHTARHVPLHKPSGPTMRDRAACYPSPARPEFSPDWQHAFELRAPARDREY